jgi:RNA polymerase sigma factor (sigma-70 family)
MTGAHRLAEATYRQEAGRLVGALTRQIGDFDLAEEAVQEALIEALDHWQRDGLPERPAAWLAATARRKAIDRLRREARGREKLAELALSPLVPDSSERLTLLFLCCHPALAPDAQVALTLRAVAGLTTPEIARAFLAGEPTVAQRIVRAKRKVVAAGIPYRMPDDRELQERLHQVLTVLYLTFNEGYLASQGEVAERRGLAGEAEQLAALLTRLLPQEPEPLGLLALMRLHLARTASRFDPEGHLVRLEDQDRSLWDSSMIAAAGRLLERAATHRRPGPYQLQAAIVAVHAEARSYEDTDWPQVVSLYGLLLRHQDTPVVRLNRAIALAHVCGPDTALAEVDRQRQRLDAYHLFHATRGELLTRLGRTDEAREAYRRAMELTLNPAERALLAERLG